MLSMSYCYMFTCPLMIANLDKSVQDNQAVGNKKKNFHGKSPVPATIQDRPITCDLYEDFYCAA